MQRLLTRRDGSSHSYYRAIQSPQTRGQTGLGPDSRTHSFGFSLGSKTFALLLCIGLLCLRLLTQKTSSIQWLGPGGSVKTSRLLLGMQAGSTKDFHVQCQCRSILSRDNMQKQLEG